MLDIFIFTFTFKFIYSCKCVNVWHISECFGQILAPQSLEPHKHFPFIFLQHVVLFCNRAFGPHPVQSLFQQQGLQPYESPGIPIIWDRKILPSAVVQGSMTGRTGGREGARYPSSSCNDSAKLIIWPSGQMVFEGFLMLKMARQILSVPWFFL